MEHVKIIVNYIAIMLQSQEMENNVFKKKSPSLWNIEVHLKYLA